MKSTVKVEVIERKIIIIRSQKVIIDSDLAKLYGATTKVLNQAVKRNIDRFPDDFMFKLTKNEKQEVVTNCDHLVNLKFSPVLPNAFTEHGAIMAASVLNTTLAIKMSVFVVRAFIKFRKLLFTHKELSNKIDQLEQRLENHDEAIKSIVAAIREMTIPGSSKKKTRIGFNSK